MASKTTELYLILSPGLAGLFCEHPLNDKPLPVGKPWVLISEQAKIVWDKETVCKDKRFLHILG